MKPRLILAILLPFIACAVQWMLWDALKPYVWFLFFPTAFFSAWIGGLLGGLAATLISTLLVWYFFIPPAFSFTLANPASAFSIVVFIFMGCLFAYFFERLQQAMQRTEEALTAAEAAKDKITELYQKTLELDTLKNQFFANVSHELRTPLTLILAPLEQRLRRSIGPDFSESERHETEIMLRNARLLYRHVTDLLDAAKLGAGRMALAWSRIDLSLIAKAMASHFDLLAAEHHIDYSVTVPEKLMAEADSEKLQRVLLNLLSNAFKFTPDGGAIALHLSQNDKHVLISVQDNGPGVPAVQRESVFDRFSQGEGDARRRHGGTGLGLSIVKEFVELHNGTVTLGEAPGGGALFSVRLPIAAPTGTALVTPVVIDAVIDRQVIEELEVRARVSTLGDLPTTLADAPLVLVVEDNVDMNEFIATTLRSSYRVATAFDGREGMEKALTLSPDLILADVMMAGMSGDEMVLALRQHPGMEDVPIVMLTAKADDDLRVRLLDQGVQAYLNKPFATDELLALLGGLISERRRTARKLLESEARFKATFEQAAVGIALVAPDGRWLRVNNKLCEIIGYTHDELMTKTFQDITYPDDLNADLTFVQQMLVGEINSYSMEKRYICKDGSIVWINLSVALTRNPDASPNYFISVVENIHQRKQSEAALLETAATLKEAQQLAGIGNWRWDVKNDVHAWSEEVYLIYGRDPSLPPAIYPEVQQYFTPESWAKLSADVETALASGLAYECDAEVVRPDGEHRWITARGEAARDAGGNLINLHGTVQDITQRMQTEAILKASEEKYRTLVETTDTGYLILDMEGKVVDANPEYVRLTGHDTLSDILGRSVTEWTADYEKEKNLKAVMQCVKDGFIKDLLIDYADKNGRITPVEINATVANDDHSQRIISLIRDISERRRAEQMLRDNEARMAGIINSAMDAVISVDEQQRIHLFNPAAAQMFGINATAAIGQPLENLIPQRFRLAHAGHINNFAQKGITARRMGVLGEISGLRANGEEFPIEASISHTSLAGGKLFTVILRDITDRHRAEEEIRQLNANLERHVEERTSELSAANRELDSFSYAVSHDLRAPLRAMSGFSRALSEDYASQLQGEAKVYLDQIDIASRKMSDLIDGLLVLSRITRGELLNDTVKLSTIAEQLLAELARNDAQRHVTVQVESGLQMRGDARMIEVVMRNLLENAWKYTAHTAAPTIRVYSEEHEGQCRICVADNGAGFDMAHANRLFQPFQRLHRQEEFPGIGIGLATVQRIVRRHGGVMEAHGEPGKGAVFCFTLADTPGVSSPDKRES